MSAESGKKNEVIGKRFAWREWGAMLSRPYSFHLLSPLQTKGIV